MIPQRTKHYISSHLDSHSEPLASLQAETNNTWRLAEPAAATGSAAGTTAPQIPVNSSTGGVWDASRADQTRQKQTHKQGRRHTKGRRHKENTSSHGGQRTSSEGAAPATTADGRAGQTAARRAAAEGRLCCPRRRQGQQRRAR